MKKNLQQATLAFACSFMLSLSAQAQTQVTLASTSTTPYGGPFQPVLEVRSTAASGSYITNGSILTARDGYDNYGGLFYAIGGSNYNNAVFGLADSAGVSGVGVLGISQNAVSSNFGVYGIGSGGAYNWAGYFVGDVYSTGSYLPSDQKLKTNIHTEEDVLPKLQLLKPVLYHYKSDELKFMNLPKTLQHGLVAQDIKEVFPEMVTELENPVLKGNKFDHAEKSLAVNYTMLIPVLIKAVQEQQSQIEELQAKIEQLSGKAGTIKTPLSGLSLSQNTPNPSSASTEIRYSIPTNVTNATLGVYDLTGKQVLQFAGVKGTSKVVIEKGKLSAGIYIYSLLVNGQEALSKKMIIAQ